MPKSKSNVSDTAEVKGGFEQIPFTMHPRLFSELGERLVTNEFVAIMELIKNAYDAFATRVDITFEESDGKRLISIQDDGEGMPRNIIEKVWCTVATPYRAEERVSERAGKKRVVSGAKGLGRLCSARLGKQLYMVTRSKGQPCWDVKVNWDSLAGASDLSGCEADIKRNAGDAPFQGTGTLLKISDLRDEWPEDKLAELKTFLSRLITPFKRFRGFSVFFSLPGEEAEEAMIRPPSFIDSPPYKVAGSVDKNGKLSITYACSKQGAEREKEHDELLRRKAGQPVTDEVRKHFAKTPTACGPFDFEIRAWDMDDSLLELCKRFHVEGKRKFRAEMRPFSGITLYRDNVLVLPKSDTARDWLGLDLRRVSRIGNRVSTSQLVGYVAVTTESNGALQDTADRERLVSNDAASQFREFINQIVGILEAERDKDRLDAKHKEPPLANLLGDLSDDKFVQAVSARVSQGATASDILDAVVERSAERDKVVREVETRFVYYSQLASIGSLAEMVLHEIRNHTSTLGGFVRDVKDALQKGALPGDIDKSADLAERSLRSLDRLASQLLPLANRTFRTRRRTSVLEEIIAQAVELRDGPIRHARIGVSLPKGGETKVAMDPGELMTVIINLLDNAVYWLSTKSEGDRHINIVTNKSGKEDRVFVTMHDDGPGVGEDDAERVFWPGVTRRPGGLGMGLTIASELVAQHEGNMQLLRPGKLGGASFRFDVPVARRG